MWAGLWARTGNARKCVRERLESARPRYAGGAEHPAIAGAKAFVGMASSCELWPVDARKG